MEGGVVSLVNAIIKSYITAMKLTFYGGAKEVTGVNYLLTSQTQGQPTKGLAKFFLGSKAQTKPLKILVDCGLIQGSHFLDLNNLNKFAYNPKEIDYLFISHAHIDHVGRIPKLYKEGFRGKIICSGPTRDLAEVSLNDSFKILEESCAKLGKASIYSQQDITNSLKLFYPVEYDKKYRLASSSGKFEFRTRQAGHILGSCITEIWLDGQKIVFTGDLGNTPPPMILPTEYINETDYLVIESAYGDRNHPEVTERKVMLERAIEEVISKKGVLMIPMVAVEKAQELLFEMNELMENNRVPSLPIFLDSPLAIKVTEIYGKYQQYFNDQAKELIRSGDDIFKFPGLRFTRTREESMAINDVQPPKVIMAGSGTGMGGRITHHEQRYLADPNSTLLLIGFQLPGSSGQQIQNGAKTVTIHGQPVEVRATVKVISGYSAHADQKQLKNFVAQIRKPIKKVFVTQGEERASQTLATIIRDELGIQSVVPNYGETFQL